MSFIQITDEGGSMMLLSLKRVDKIKIEYDAGLTLIILTPINKDDPKERILSATPVEDIWDQIKLRM